MRVIIILIMLFATPVNAMEDKCVCSRESTDPVCVAYYELLDADIEGMSVKLVCKEVDK